MGETSQMPLLVLGSAIALTTASGADAALISTAGAGFIPVTITAGTTGSYSFDLDANGSQDFSITAGTSAINFNLLSQQSAVSSLFNTVSASSSATTLNTASVKHSGDVFTFSSSQPSPNNYLALATDFVRTNPTDVFSSGTGIRGYLQGDYSPGTTGATVVPASFRLTDFGLVTSDVPEPASWVMMITGFGGIGALRRRARAKAASPATC